MRVDGWLTQSVAYTYAPTVENFSDECLGSSDDEGRSELR